jgi:hypothetical protein
MKALATKSPVIPGICIAIETEKKTGLVFDPLSETEDGKRIMDQLNATHARFEYVFGGEKKAWPRREYQLTADELKTWAHVMRQLCDEGLAKSLKHPLPSRAEIAGWPGRRRRDPGNTGQQAEKLREFVDEVPEGEPVLAGEGTKGKK